VSVSKITCNYIEKEGRYGVKLGDYDRCEKMKYFVKQIWPWERDQVELEFENRKK
jgi:hypothetical protein